MQTNTNSTRRVALQDLSETQSWKQPSLTSAADGAADHQRLSVNHCVYLSLCVYFQHLQPDLVSSLKACARGAERTRGAETNTRGSVHLFHCSRSFFTSTHTQRNDWETSELQTSQHLRLQTTITLQYPQSLQLLLVLLEKVDLWSICSINDSLDEFITSSIYTLYSWTMGYLQKAPKMSWWKANH